MPHLAYRLAWLIVLLPGLAAADPTVTIRQGRHGDMGRLVFDFAGAETFQTQRDGASLTIEFTPGAPIGAIALHIPGLDSMQGGAGTVQLQLAAGAVPDIYRLGNRIVVDAGVPHAGRHAAKAAGAPSRKLAKAKPQPRALASSQPPAPPQIQAALPASVVLPDIHFAALTTGVTMPVPTPAISLAAPAIAPALPASSPVTISFVTQPGAAAFRRGDQAIIVFDTSEVPDLTALQSAPGFANATLLSLQDAQVISFTLPAANAITLTPVTSGWQVAATPAAQAVLAPPQTSASAVEFPMQSANQSIIISDPFTGGNLLIGTVTHAGDAADYTESGPGYAVLPAWLGVAIVPQADTLGLNPSLKGFELVSGAPKGLPLGSLPPPMLEAAAQTGAGQYLTLPNGSLPDLWKRLVADQRIAATLPPLGRLNAQLVLAQDMLALGMGAEAVGVLQTAVLENPAARDNGQIAEMRAVADVLSHRSQKQDFAAPGIVPGTETEFWRAVAALDKGDTGQAALASPAGLKLFETYPDALRNTVTAEIAEALADTGRLQPAMQLAGSDPGNHLLDLARAKILEQQGQAKPALAAYQTLAHSADTRVAAIANARIVELQLAAGQLNAAQAADALDAGLFDWRDPEHERHMRLRVAQLRAAAGEWPQAFTMLQSARKLFPGHREEINAIRAAMFLKMLGSNAFASLSPIEAVALLQQNQDLITGLNAGTQVIDLLAKRLDQLDLPGAAAPMLSSLIQTIPQGAAQASLGATLAQVDLDAGSPVAALADLSQTEADNLPPNLQMQRNTLAAKAQAQAGNAIAAVDTLAPVTALNGPAPTSPPAASSLDTQTLDARAQIAEQSGQWQQAQQALSSLVAQAVPATGPISGNQENLLLRLATAASHTNDAATLAALASQYAGRMGPDAAGQMFQTLTAPPLTGDQGLNQALHEIAQLQALPAMVNALAGTPAAKP